MKIAHNIDKKARKNGCPMGANCNTCNWYQPAYKRDRSGEVVEQVMDCMVKLIAVQLDELKGRNMGVQAAVESLRNVVISGNDRLQLVSRNADLQG